MSRCLTDPVYLSEPFMRTTDMARRTRDPDAWLYACDDGEQVVGRPLDQVAELSVRQESLFDGVLDKYNIPLAGALWAAPETTYPEYMAKIKDPGGAEAAAKAEQFPAPGPQHTSKAVDPDAARRRNPCDAGAGQRISAGGRDSNIAVQTGDQGAFVVDAGSGKMADKVVAADQEAGRRQADSVHCQHQFPCRSHGRQREGAGRGRRSQRARVVLLLGSASVRRRGRRSDHHRPPECTEPHERAHRESRRRRRSDGWPSDTFLDGRRRKYYNDEAIEVFWEPNASTDGDTIVHFRRSDVIATGDIFDTTRFPFIDVKNGGSIFGEIDALNNILDKTVYKHEGEGGTLIIPGHGRICDEYEVSEYRDMLAVIRDRVQAMIKSGATLPQVQDAQLTADYDDRYGATSGDWTTNMFVEAIYTSLKDGRPKLKKPAALQ